MLAERTAVRTGWALVLAAILAAPAAFMVGFVAWLLTPAGLWFLRRSPRWTGATTPAFVCWVVLVLAALLGAGVTFGFAGETVASGGDIDSAYGAFSMGVFLVALGPVAVLLLAAPTGAWVKFLAACVVVSILANFAVAGALPRTSPQPDGSNTGVPPLTALIVVRLTLTTYVFLAAGLIAAYLTREDRRAAGQLGM